MLADLGEAAEGGGEEGTQRRGVGDAHDVVVAQLQGALGAAAVMDQGGATRFLAQLQAAVGHGEEGIDLGEGGVAEEADCGCRGSGGGETRERELGFDVAHRGELARR